MNAWLADNWMECLGWTLVHFVWEGAIMAMLLAVSLHYLRGAKSNHRYLAGCAALLLLTIAPLITVCCVAKHYPVLMTSQANDIVSGQISKPAIDPHVDQPVTVARGTLEQHDTTFFGWFEKYLPLIVVAWLLGVSIFLIRLLMGWLHIRRMRRLSILPVQEFWHEKLEQLRRRLNLRRAVQLMESALVEAPTVIGWLRPVILLPASCLTGLSAAQLEAILAHELAHIQRQDYLVNLLQSLVETFLFYHPAVWWVSRRIREERENCCDDLAVELCGDRVVYARALATLEEIRVSPAQLCVAADGGSLLQRIQRLLRKPASNTAPSIWPVTMAGIFILVAAVMMGMHGNRAAAQDAVKAQTNAPVSPVAVAHDANKTSLQNTRLTRLLHQIKIDSVKYDGWPLIEALNDLSRIIKAKDHLDIPFVIPPPELGQIDAVTGLPVTDQREISKVTIRMDKTLTNAWLADVLDAIVTNADEPIHYFVLNKSIEFSTGNTAPLLDTRVFHLNSKSFQNLIRHANAVPPDANGKTEDRTAALNKFNGQLRDYWQAAGVDLSLNNPANAGKTFYWNDNRGTLMVRATPQDLAIIESILLKYSVQISQVMVEVRFAEYDEIITKKAGFDWLFANIPDWQAVSNQPPPVLDFQINYGAMTNDLPAGVLRPTTNSLTSQIFGSLTRVQYDEVIRKIEQQNGMDILNVPRVTTESGRKARVSSGEAMTIVTGLNDIPGINPTRAYLTTNLLFGPVADLVATVSDDNKQVSLNVTTSVTSFLGYDDPAQFGLSAPHGVVVPLPRFAIMDMSARMTIKDCHTLVLAGTDIERTEVKTNKSFLGMTSRKTIKTKKNLLVFITPTLINPDGTRFNADDYDSPAPTNSKARGF